MTDTAPLFSRSDDAGAMRSESGEYTPEPWHRGRVPAWPVIGIFLILLFQFITDAKNFLMPVTLATLLFFVFTPFRRLMTRLGVKSTVTAAIVTLGLLAAIAGIGYAVSGPVSKMVENADSIGTRLENSLRDVRDNFKGIQKAAARIDEVAAGGGAEDGAETPPAPGAKSVEIHQPDVIARATVTTDAPADPASAPVQQDITVNVDAKQSGDSVTSRVLALGPEILSQAGFTLLLLFFLIDSGDLFYLRIVQSFGSMTQKRAAYSALRAIEDSLGAYLGAITLINALLGVATGLAMWAWGMPSPLMFGLGMFVLNFIPYIGSITMTTAAAVTALLVHGDLFHALVIGATVVALTATEGNLITPYFVSRRLQLNPVVVFLTVALWAWLWSILGMVVAVPVLVVLRVLCDHVPGLERLGNFLAGEDAPIPAEDEEEAEQEEQAPPAPRA